MLERASILEHMSVGFAEKEKSERGSRGTAAQQSLQGVRRAEGTFFQKRTRTTALLYSVSRFELDDLNARPR